MRFARQLPADVQATLQLRPAAPDPPVCEKATDVFYRAFNGRYPRSDGMRDYAMAMNTAGKGANDELYNAMWGSSEFVSTGTLKDYDGEPLLAKLDGRNTLHRRPI